MKQVAKRISVFVLAIAVCMTLFSVPAQAREIIVTQGNFEITLYQDEESYGSAIITKYTGNESTVVLPSTVTYKNNKIPILGVKEEVFQNKQSIKKVVIPDGYQFIGEFAFKGCNNLTEMVIGNTLMSMGHAFVGCPNLKTYRIANSAKEDTYFANSGMGSMEASATTDFYKVDIQGVEAHVVRGSKADKDIQIINEHSKDMGGYEIKLIYEDDPTGDHGKKDDPEPKNPYEKGASYDRADKAITKYSSEKDVPGSVYGLLQLKQKKVKKNAIKVSWKKVPGAVKYAYYATNCGVKNKYKKHGITTGTSKNFKKILGKKLKKGKYYKFIVIAIDKNNKVVSTSKTVHVATKGGKVTNDKKVKTKVKKNKKTIKVKKTFKIKAKEVKPKKGKVKRHRPIKYESLNPKVASVNGKGVVKGASKGKTYVFAYAQNGVAAKVKVTVK